MATYGTIQPDPFKKFLSQFKQSNEQTPNFEEGQILQNLLLQISKYKAMATDPQEQDDFDQSFNVDDD